MQRAITGQRPILAPDGVERTRLPADEIGKMLEKSMGTERFNAALKALDEKENTQ